MKLLDDPSQERCHLVFLAQGAMGRRQKDIWVRLVLIAEALRRHARGKAARLIKVKRHIHRFLAELLWAVGVQRATDLGEDVWHNLLRSPSSAWKEIYNSAVRNEQGRLDDDPVPKAVTRALRRLDLRPLGEALTQLPVRARGGAGRVSERLNIARKALRQVEEQLWKELLAQARWRSPLLVMDEGPSSQKSGHPPRPAVPDPKRTRATHGGWSDGPGLRSNAFSDRNTIPAWPS